MKNNNNYHVFVAGGYDKDGRCELAAAKLTEADGTPVGELSSRLDPNNNLNGEQIALALGCTLAKLAGQTMVTVHGSEDLYDWIKDTSCQPVDQDVDLCLPTGSPEGWWEKAMQEARDMIR